LTGCDQFFEDVGVAVLSAAQKSESNSSRTTPPTMSQPRISVIMPVWNGEKYVAEALDSILGQTLTDWELIAVDGGSSDSTMEILGRYKDPRIRIFQTPDSGTGSGLVAGRNLAIAKSHAPWIACQDADDIALPHRLERQWAALDRTPGAVLSYTEVEYIGDLSSRPGHARLPRTRALLALKLCYFFPVAHSTIMFKRESLLAAGGYEGRFCEDFRLLGKLVELGTPVAVPETLLKFRLHEVSASKRFNDGMLETAQELRLDHCRRFMQLDGDEAVRARDILNRAPGVGRKDWWWFVRHCVPRLRWQSAEMKAWVGWQCLKRGTI
jgi:glycosyltransferase involved in cell wall biosynthesis